MRRLFLFAAICGALAVGGCADPLEQRTTEDVGSQLERGITGQGTIGPQDRSPGDPAAEHGVPETHP